jgi:multisubunit Na+/H+ antiporter MnhB subunit
VNQRVPAFPRAVYAALAIIVLLGVVAFASRGHEAPGVGSGGQRGPVQYLVDIVFTLLIVGGIGVVIALAFMHATTKREIKRSPFRSVVAIGVFAVLLSVSLFLLPRLHLGVNQGLSPAQISRLPSASESNFKQAKQPVFHWSAAVGTGALLLAVLAVMIARERRRRLGAARDWSVAKQIADDLDDTLDDLRAEPDARKAIIAAYARMERSLALHGLPRRESEAPLEYMARVLAELQASQKAVGRLTDLFAVAKFSDHPVSHGQKVMAIEALESIRDDLRALDREDGPTLRPEQSGRVPSGVIG